MVMAAPPPASPRSSFTRAMRTKSSLRIRPLGLRTPFFDDLYHRLMRMSWARLSSVFFVSFMLFNLVFAALYRVDPSGLAMAREGAAIPLFWRDFFFSVHTVATIGYGNVYPVSGYANWMVVIEITLGILFFAVTTGIVFARFSRPTGRIMFSEVAVVREVDGVPTLMMRAANQRHNLIYSARVEVSLLEDQRIDGKPMRRFCDLDLVRTHNPVFALTWTIMHRIDEASPLRGWIENREAIGTAEIVVVLSGTDEESGQTVYGRWAYDTEDIRWDARFADILGVDSNGVRTIDYSRFHVVEA